MNYLFSNCLSQRLPLLGELHQNGLELQLLVPVLPLHKAGVKYSSSCSGPHLYAAEETHFSKPAKYTRVAAAGFKVVCVQICLIAFVYACVSVCEVFICKVRVFDWYNFARGVCVRVWLYMNTVMGIHV